MMFPPENKRFRCSVCDKGFTQKGHLTRHMLVHTGEKKFRCSVCGKLFSLREYLTTHMLIHTGERNFPCDRCGLRFATKGRLTSHMAYHTGEVGKLFSCSVCDQRFKTNYQRTKHRRGCPQSSHLRQRHTEQVETGAGGEDCGGPQPARNSHPETHLQPDTKDSDGCKETSEPQSGVESLKSDVRISSTDKPFSCTECDKQFALKSHLRIHTKKHRESPYSCSTCGKGFLRKGELEDHMIIHIKEKMFSCNICDQRFTWFDELRKHKCVGHLSSQPHQSQTEDRSGSKSLKRQKVPESDLRGHSAKTSFSCTECGRQFDMARSLTIHMKTHLVHKPFSCSVCGSRFNEKTQLTEHMFVHTGKREFSCPVCGEGFNLNTRLRDHMVVHIGEKIFSCSVCGEKFAWCDQLKKHKRVSHPSSALQQNQTEQNMEASSSTSEQTETGADGEEYEATKSLEVEMLNYRFHL